MKRNRKRDEERERERDEEIARILINSSLESLK